MIITVLLTVFLALLMGMFGALPSIPPVPAAIESAASEVIGFVENGASLLHIIFAPALLSAAVVVILAMFFFHQIYFVVLWVLKKIPIINIK